jgi:hypothetical protein
MARPKKAQRKGRPPASTVYWHNQAEKDALIAALRGQDFSAWARAVLLREMSKTGETPHDEAH